MTRAKLRSCRVAEILPEHIRDGLLNVIVFGPGRGEAIVVILPDGQIGVVDGCCEPRDVDTGRGDPVRELLNGMGVRNPDLRLRFVCLTHPHSDHYSALGRLLRAYEGRVDEVWRPFETGARYVGTYRKWAELKNERSTPEDRQDLRGLNRVFVEMRGLHGNARPELKTVLRDVPLLRQIMGNRSLSILGVAPSTADTDRAQETLASALQALKPNAKPSGSHNPNDSSGALLIRCGLHQPPQPRW